MGCVPACGSAGAGSAAAQTLRTKDEKPPRAGVLIAEIVAQRSSYDHAMPFVHLALDLLPSSRGQPAARLNPSIFNIRADGCGRAVANPYGHAGAHTTLPSLLGFVSSIRRRVVVLYPKIVFRF